MKDLIARLWYHSRLLDMVSAKKLSDRGFVLMYHRIINSEKQDNQFIQPGIYVTGDTLEKQLLFLRKHFSIITLDEMVRRLSLGQAVSRCCSITFDDGWKDTYEVAFPLLIKYQVPVSIFLATGYIGTEKWFWPEELTRCLWLLLNPITNYPEKVSFLRQLNIDVNNNKRKSRSSLIDGVIEQVKRYNPDQREYLIKGLRKAFPDDSRESLLMSWDEVTQMQKSGLASFGAHTVNHVYLDQVKPKVIWDEISFSKQMIEKNLGIPVTLFAYPNGGYTASAIAMLEQSRFLGAVTTRRGYVGKNISLMEIPRIGMHEDVSKTIPLFFSRLMLSSF